MDSHITIYVDSKIDRYRTQMIHNRRRFRQWKLTQMIVAGLIPVISTFGSASDMPKRHPGLTLSILGVFGFSILVVEAVQQIFQFQQLWNSYRVSYDSLDGERFLFTADAGPYRSLDPESKIRMYAEHVEALISTGQSERNKIIMKLEEELKASPTAAPTAN